MRITLLLGIAPLLAVAISALSFYSGSRWKEWELSDRSEFTRIEMIMSHLEEPCDFSFALKAVYSDVSEEQKTKDKSWLWLGQLEEVLRFEPGYGEKGYCQ